MAVRVAWAGPRALPGSRARRTRVTPRDGAARHGARRAVWWRGAALGLAIAWGAAPRLDAAPVADYIGLTITEVRVFIEGREVHDPELLGLVEARAGGPLTMSDVRESMTHFMGLGEFDDVQVHATRTSGGVALRYELMPMHAVERVEFRGLLGLPERRLREAMIERYGQRPAVGRASDVTRLLKDLYRRHGYLSARVTTRPVVQHVPERTVLVFDVDAGPQARVGDVVIDGVPPVPAPQFLEGIGLRPGQAYEAPAVERRLSAYRDDLRTRGYFEAELRHVARERDGGRLVDVTLAVRTGPHVVVAFTGDPLSEAEQDELVPVRREGSVDQDLLEDSTLRIREYLRSQGYWQAQAEYTPTRTGNELRIVFNVRRGQRYVLAGLEVVGSARVPRPELEPLIRSEKGGPFVAAVLDSDVQRILEHYRSRGFDAAKVEWSLEDAARSGPSVTPRIVIREGVQTLIGAVGLDGDRAIPESTLRSAIRSLPGAFFYRPQVAVDRDSVLLQYVNQGYPDASVDVSVSFNADRSRADLHFTIVEGEQVRIDHILVVGNARTSTETIRRELLVKPGEPLGLGAVLESQRRLSALGLFRRVSITEIRAEGPSRDLLVRVEEAPATSVGYGGGIEAGRRLRRSQEAGGQAVERLEFAPQGFFEIGRRNLWGKNRSVNVFARASFRPKDAPDDPSRDGRGYGFSEYRFVGTYREPRVLGTAADALATVFFEQAIRSSFNFNRLGALAELARRVTPTLSVLGRYAYGRTELFDERFAGEDQPLVDRLFPQVVLSSVSGSVVRDTRNDSLEPTRGGLLGVDGEIAARGLGSEVGFAKTFLQAFVYRPVPRWDRAVLAGGARLGLATGLPRQVLLPDLGPDGRELVATVKDLPASERFFAGGDTTVRGFALDRLGSPATIDPAGFPRGGHALIVFNAELRVRLWRDLGAVWFVDAGNVFARVSDVDLGQMRGAVGLGLRYRSPVGPLRVDLGFKLDRQQIGLAEREGRTALHISIGQAF